MLDRGGERTLHAHDARVYGGCPVCSGVLAARITPSGVWTWCAQCRRLARAAVIVGPAGPVFIHPTAVA